MNQKRHDTLLRKRSENEGGGGREGGEKERERKHREAEIGVTLGVVWGQREERGWALPHRPQIHI